MPSSSTWLEAMTVDATLDSVSRFTVQLSSAIPGLAAMQRSIRLLGTAVAHRAYAAKR